MDPMLLEYWTVLLPIVLIELVLMVLALVHIFRHDNYKYGNRIAWVIVVIMFQIIGPIMYFAIGRSEE